MQLEMGAEFSNVLFLQLFFVQCFNFILYRYAKFAHIYIYSWTYSPDMETTSPTMHVILMHHQVVILAAPLTASEVGVSFFFRRLGGSWKFHDTHLGWNKEFLYQFFGKSSVISLTIMHEVWVGGAVPMP